MGGVQITIDEERESEEVRRVTSLFPLGDILTREESVAFAKMLEALADVFGVSPGRLQGNWAKRFKHYIEISKSARPIYMKQRRMAPKEAEFLRKYIQELKAIDAIENTISPWNSQVILVPKAGKRDEFRPTSNR